MARWTWLVMAIGLVARLEAAEPPAAPQEVKPPQAGETPAKPEIVRLSPTRLRLGVIEFDQTTREIFLPSKVNMVKGLLEYAVVGEKGKLHEALLSTRARAFDLNVVLLLLNYQPDTAWFVPPAKPKPLEATKPAARLDILVRWKDPGGGGEKTARLDEWITDLVSKKPAPATPWVFSGSQIYGERQFAAEVDGSLVALYLDTRALINSPREGADNDEQWVPSPAVPPKGTAVTVIIRPAK
jgi:hypothetical protein